EREGDDRRRVLRVDRHPHHGHRDAEPEAWRRDRGAGRGGLLPGDGEQLQRDAPAGGADAARRRGDGNAAEGNAGRSDRRGSLLSNHRDVIGISATASRHASLTDMKKRASWLDSDRSLETDCPAGAGRNRQGIERVRVTRTVLTEIDGGGRAVEVVKSHLGRE